MVSAASKKTQYLSSDFKLLHPSNLISLTVKSIRITSIAETPEKL